MATSEQKISQAIAGYLGSRPTAQAAFYAAQADYFAARAAFEGTEEEWTRHYGAVIVGLSELAMAEKRQAEADPAFPVRDAAKWQCRECGSTSIHLITTARFDANSGAYLERADADGDSDAYVCTDCGIGGTEIDGGLGAIEAPSDQRDAGWRCDGCDKREGRPFVRLNDGRPDGGFSYYCATCEGDAVASGSVAPR